MRKAAYECVTLYVCMQVNIERSLKRFNQTKKILRKLRDYWIPRETELRERNVNDANKTKFKITHGVKCGKQAKLKITLLGIVTNYRFKNCQEDT